jgi:flagellar hook assembly protein FlgD
MGVQLRNATSSGANWQRVDQESNSLIVVAEPQQKELFRDLAIVPAVFTPNGDDRNEQTNVTFTLLSVGVGTGVAVEVYDLSGRLVRRLDEQRDNSTGSYAIPWDGLDARGNLVAPGMYAVRVKLAGATSGSGLDQVEQLRTVAVAY